MFIEIRNITKIYQINEDVQLRALDNVSLSIGRSEFISIMGPSGSGKTTLLNIIGFLDSPTGGQYYLSGKEFSHLSRTERANIRNRQISFVFQGFNLLPRTSALDNVGMPLFYRGVPAAERREKARIALEAVGLDRRETAHPNQLSIGQQQRVAIARAIAAGNPILLADEPTGNLDTKTSREIMDIFTRLNEESGTTIILVTHDESVAGYSKRLIRFLDGAIVFDKILESRKKQVVYGM